MITGNWNVDPNMGPCNLPQALATAFSEATHDLNGANYEPALYVAQQLVAGMNYMLICKQTLILKEPKISVVKMVIHDPLPVEKQQHGAKATIISIENLL